MKSRSQNSFLDIASVEKNKIDLLFSFADRIYAKEKMALQFEGFRETGALLFFEPSTRTRMSFETACARWGIYPLLLDGKSGTSLEKGETLEDTVLNVDAMKPAFLVIRCGDELNLKDLAQKVQSPILNAGWGKRGHPTQALLDAYTVQKKLGTCKGQRILIVGDVRHSRVAASHLELATKLEYEVAFCGPQEFLPSSSVVRVYENLKEGLEWATVAMALRVQFERHEEHHNLANYREKFGFTCENLKSLSPDSLILHPGPINQGVELDAEVLRDSRCQILEQVSNGVLIRQSLIYCTISGEF